MIEAELISTFAPYGVGTLFALLFYFDGKKILMKVVESNNKMVMVLDKLANKIDRIGKRMND